MDQAITQIGMKYAETTRKIIGSAMRVHSTLGNGFQEVVYQRALAIEMKDSGLNFMAYNLKNNNNDVAKFGGKYRIASARKPGWNYGSNGAYFVTICTKNRIPYFGTIDDEINYFETKNGNVNTHKHILYQHDCTRMKTTQLGNSARKCWLNIPNHFPFVKLDAFVVMPNHVHGIIIINKKQNRIGNNRFGPQSQNLASIIRGFKIGVTKFARGNDINFEWQDKYHDYVIRDNDDIDRIRKYIELNPLKWVKSKYYDKYFRGEKS